MPRLGIYNGDSFVREVDLPAGTLRVGRSEQNDLVLADAAKTVSRFHAELRVEGAACTIVDLNSQNGTWVGGRRVQEARLGPGQSATLGTYRVVLQPGESHKPAPEEPGSALGESAPQRPTAAAPSPDATLADPPPVPAPSMAGTARPKPVTGAPGGRQHRVLLLAGAALCLAAAGIAGRAWWTPRDTAPLAPEAAAVAPGEPGPGAPPVEPPVGVPAEVVASAPTPASALLPPALSAPARLAPSPAAPASGRPPAPTQLAMPERLVRQARAAIDKGDYVTAAPLLERALRLDAGNPEVIDLLDRVRSQGLEAFRRAQQMEAGGRRQGAAGLYEKTLRLLPPDHPSARQARERLALIR